MAHFTTGAEAFIQVLRAECIEPYVEYVIEVKISPINWLVKHRYSEFYDLNQKLVKEYGLDKKLLPPKKAIGNTTDAFIQKRRSGLEKYLQIIMNKFNPLPYCIATFLDFHRYEVSSVTQVLAELLFKKGELLLAKQSLCSMDPLQLHAISHRLLNADTVELSNNSQDLGHVLDFVTRLRSLKVIGTSKVVSSSNLNINTLSFSVALFKDLRSLEVLDCDITNMEGIETIRPILEKISIRNSMKSLKDFMCIGDVYWENGDGEDGEASVQHTWPQLKWVDFSGNHITSLHESLVQLDRVEYLDLHDNYLEELAYMNTLCHLSHVDLSNNRIRTLHDLHIKLGNVRSVNLSGNKLESLSGFSKLYSLEYLDISNNQVSQMSELRYLGSLPLLTNIMVAGNSITHIPDYRIQILKIFGDRAKEVKLDNQNASEKELDTVAVLIALDSAKNLNEPAKPSPASQASIAGSSDNVGCDEYLGTPSTHTNRIQRSSQSSQDEAQPLLSDQEQSVVCPDVRFGASFTSRPSSSDNASFQSVDSENEPSDDCSEHSETPPANPYTNLVSDDDIMPAYEEALERPATEGADTSSNGDSVAEIQQQASNSNLTTAITDECSNVPTTADIASTLTAHDIVQDPLQIEHNSPETDEITRNNDLLTEASTEKESPVPIEDCSSSAIKEASNENLETTHIDVDERPPASSDHSSPALYLSAHGDSDDGDDEESVIRNQSENVPENVPEIDSSYEMTETERYLNGCLALPTHLNNIVNITKYVDDPDCLLVCNVQHLIQRFKSQSSSLYKDEALRHAGWCLTAECQPSIVLLSDQALYVAYEDRLLRIKYSMLSRCALDEKAQVIELCSLDGDHEVLFLLLPRLTQTFSERLSGALEGFESEETDEGASIYDRPHKSKIIFSNPADIFHDQFTGFTPEFCYCALNKDNTFICRIYTSKESRIAVAVSPSEITVVDFVAELEVNRSNLTLNFGESGPFKFAEEENFQDAIQSIMLGNPDCYINDK